MPSRPALPVIVFFLLLPVTGCSVFSPIGSAISSAYGNTVAYFNAYYNARNLFDEAEKEIHAVSLSRRDFLQGETSQASAIPPSATQKLNLVVDKCSNILAFHPESALVDDALLLIGKSYYYMGEYAKAERKFTELLSQFPQSEHRLVSQLWLIKAGVHLSNPTQALDVATNLVNAALEEGEEGVAGQTHIIVGDYYVNQGESRQAIDSYARALPLIEEKIDRAITMLKIGNLWIAVGEPQNALKALLNVREYTSDGRLLSQSGLLAVRVSRELGRHFESLELCNMLLKDFRVLDYVKDIKLEKASTLVEMNRTDDALELLATVDTSSVRSEFSTRSAYASGQLLEKHYRNYRDAAAAYARATEFQVPTVSAQAQNRLQAINRYFNFIQMRGMIDSLLLLPDTLVVPLDSMQIVVTPIAPETDSTAPVIKIDTLWSRTIVTNHDSLRAELLASTYQVGELFYSDLEEPDSALAWYMAALESSPDSLQQPRAIFVVAELSSRDTTADHRRVEHLYQLLVDRFPSSTYAANAKQRLGLQPETESDDPARDVYTTAERKLDEGFPRDALRDFREIVRRWPESPLAAQSAYAIGWIFEHRLTQPDSAVANYRRLVERYADSPFATLVRPRIGLASVPGEETGSGVQQPQPLDDDLIRRPGVPGAQPKDDSQPGSRRERAAPKRSDIKD